MIRRAVEGDLERLNELLNQVLHVHHEARSDLFKDNSKKYDDNTLLSLINDDNNPIFVYCLENKVVGYAFCQLYDYQKHMIFQPIKGIYIDDLCVDKAYRGKHIGKQLYEYVLAYAKNMGCYNVTLNVWYDNTSALHFYESLGLHIQKIGMEVIL